MADKLSKKDIELGLDIPITRRDFIGGTLLGAGAGLLATNAPGLMAKTDFDPSKLGIGRLGPEWTGPGGVGDYSSSNGNTHDVVNAAHSLRDGQLDKILDTAKDTGELYDLIIVGGGFSGFGAGYAFKEEVGDGKRCLILDNHAMFGGEAKQNEFLVNGHKLYGSQGSNSFYVHTDKPFFPEIWHKLKLPTEFEFAVLTGTDKDIALAPDNFGPMMKWPERASTGYFYETPAGARWVKDAQKNGFEGAPISRELRRDLNNVLNNRIHPKQIGSDWERQLDTITYHDFLVNNLGVSAEVLYDYIDPYFASASFGVSGDAISAYGAYKLQMPGTLGHLSRSKRDAYSNRDFYSFPGGNATILRHMVKALVPESINGGYSVTDIGYAPVNFGELDNKKNQFQIRLGSTAIDVKHEGPLDKSEKVVVTYVKDGQAYRVRARAVIMSTGGWITRRVVSDLPATIASAYQAFHHTPMLTVSVALTNWKFMENLGISAARWFNEFSWYANIRRPMIVDGKSAPLDPSRPALMTLYVPFVQYSGRPLNVQASLGRAELFSKSYRDYELAIKNQLVTMFADSGFDPRRDIAGLVLNRWGHAYIAPQPGFYFGKDGQASPREAVAAGYGRIAFGHSEITGFQAWTSGYEQGREAVQKILGYM